MTDEPIGEPPMSQKAKWVWWSTRESIEQEIPSITAIFETLIAVPVYWWLAIHFETYGFLVFSACVAPLVLMRSDASVALGVKWFITWEVEKWVEDDDRNWSDLSRPEQVLMLVAPLIIFVTSVGANYVLAVAFLSKQASPAFAATLGFGAVAGTVATTLAALEVLPRARKGVLTSIAAGGAGLGATLGTKAVAGGGAETLAMLATLAGGFAGTLAGFPLGWFGVPFVIRIAATLHSYRSDTSPFSSRLFFHRQKFS